MKAAARDFADFPIAVQIDAARALSIAARGRKADTAKPFKGLYGGVFEFALRHRGDAFRVLYAVQIGSALWVIHAFQKKSKTGIKTPQVEIDLMTVRRAHELTGFAAADFSRIRQAKLSRFTVDRLMSMLENSTRTSK